MNGQIQSGEKQKFGGKMNSKPQFKRRNYFINKEFQGRIIFNYFILVAIGTLLFAGVFSFFSSNTLSADDFKPIHANHFSDFPWKMCIH